MELGFMDWSKRRTISLIEAYVKVPDLWDINRKGFRDRDKKQECLEKLSKEFTCTVAEITRKINTMKGQFRRDRNYIMKAKSGENESVAPKWFGYELMKQTMLNSGYSERYSHLSNDVYLKDFQAENSDEDPEASNSHSNSNDASSARFSLQPGLAGPYLLKKETHCTTILDQLLKDETFTDVTLTAEGQNIRAHKMVLCLASSYFRQVLSKESNVQNVIVFRDIKFSELKNIINFIYTGEATVDATELESFMKTAEMLEISSLCEGQKHAVARGLAASQRKRQRLEEEQQSQPKKNKSSPRTTRTQPSPPKEDYIPLLLSASMREDVVPEEDNHSQESDSDGEGEKSNSRDGSEENRLKVVAQRSIKEENEDMDEDLEPVPGRCPFCTATTFASPTDMFQHLLLRHTGTPAFPCEICLRVFLENVQLQTHLPNCTPPSLGNS